jgi:hypothetical protein
MVVYTQTLPSTAVELFTAKMKAARNYHVLWTVKFVVNVETFQCIFYKFVFGYWNLRLPEQVLA